MHTKIADKIDFCSSSNVVSKESSYPLLLLSYLFVIFIAVASHLVVDDFKTFKCINIGRFELDFLKAFYCISKLVVHWFFHFKPQHSINLHLKLCIYSYLDNKRHRPFYVVDTIDSDVPWAHTLYCLHDTMSYTQDK